MLAITGLAGLRLRRAPHGEIDSTTFGHDSLTRAKLARSRLKRARRTYFARHLLLPQSIALGLILAVLGINSLVFWLLELNLWHWYLENGGVITLIFGILVIAVNLDDHPQVLAADPLGYVGALMNIGTEIFAAWSAALAFPMSDRELNGSQMSFLQSRFRLIRVDRFITILVAGITYIAFWAWLWFVGPLNYFGFLLCGAPARQALSTGREVRKTAHVRGLGSTMGAVGVDTTLLVGLRSNEAETSGDGTRISLAARPVAYTTALLALVLFGLAAIL